MKLIEKFKMGGGLLFSELCNSSYERGQGLIISCPIGELNG